MGAFRAIATAVSVLLAWPAAAEGSMDSTFDRSCVLVQGQEIGFNEGPGCHKPSLQSPKDHARFVTTVIKAVADHPDLESKAPAVLERPRLQKHKASSSEALKNLGEKVRIQTPPSSAGYAGPVTR